MYISFRYLKTKTSIITISVIGGFIHINCQLIITKFIYKLGDDIYMYGAVLIIISLVMSIIVGIITNKLNKANFISKMH